MLSYALVLDKTADTSSTSDLIEITASASGDDHLVELAAADTANYTAGTYHWQAYVTKSTERYTVDSGTIKILPNFAAATSGIDRRSHVKKVLDALEAMLERRATKDQGSIVIAGEILAKMPIQRVLEFYNQYKAAYQRELMAERIANGLGSGRDIYVRFKN